MANYVFNIAKGRVAEYYNRVKSNDPAASAIILIPVSASGTQANMIDFASLDVALVSGTNHATEAGASWGRKTLDDTLLGALTVDNVNDRMPASVPAVTWTAPTTGQNTTGLLIAYDADTGAGTDANIIPLVHCDFVVTADGNNVVLNAGDFYRAS